MRGNAHSTNASAASSTSGIRKCLQAQGKPMNYTCNTDAGKNLFWPEATPYFGASITPKSLRASGVAPGHSVFALHTNFRAIPRPQYRESCPSRSTLLTCTTPSPTEENGPCLYLKPAETVIAQVLGSLASTMDMSASSRTDNSSLNPPRRIP